ncbi:acetyl-CoA synthetase-like protein [Trametes versicolor FP-101664 SS1]|uniref:acetyl-CoA synthetase-like protein n=1 Tax=Trametes versicolor (strain FP-101664) TaxID=717944 RepID=UPI0004621378|nr:acetyl-CoA synthetase-like protein [Trametes versicolor FP-101664 SS1]EIW54172.1 acetyl-CoA synthetase-like protein [Trametes versicolor FP-101664 SS1]
MPPYPAQHCVPRTTFSAPPLEHGLSVPGLYEYHAQHSHDHPVFTYADRDTGESHDIPFSEAWDRIGAVADVVSKRLFKPQLHGEFSGRVRPVVGILALSDALSYIYLIVALMSLDYTVFPLAPANDPEAIAHLLETKAVAQLFVSDDVELQAMAHSAADILRAKGITLELIPMIVPEDYASFKLTRERRTRQVERFANDDVVLIMHSTGSTGLPKPIPLTGKALANACNTPKFGDVDLVGKRIAAHTNSLYHTTGILSMIWPLTCGATFAFYAPARPLTVPTAANFLAAWKACKCEIVISMPAFIEGLACEQGNIRAMQELDYLVYTGAPLATSVGDKLESDGVLLVSVWGSTEVGVASKFLPQEPDSSRDWEYFEFSPHLSFYMKPQEGRKRVFEPIKIAADASDRPNLTNTEVDGRPAWARGDLLEQHATKATLEGPGPTGRPDRVLYWADAQPGTKGMLMQDPNIRSAVLFGHQRMGSGLLVEPPSGLYHEQRGEAYKDLIWPSVEKANAHLQQHAQISRNMILVASSEKPFERTLKGTTRRGVCLKLYAKEIEDMYSFDGTSLAMREFGSACNTACSIVVLKVKTPQNVRTAVIDNSA